MLAHQRYRLQQNNFPSAAMPAIAALLFIQFSKISGMSPPAAVSLKANFH
jgi:hypothetical protein